MFKFETNRSDIENDLLDEVKLFFPDFENENLVITHTYEKNKEIENKIVINKTEYKFISPLITADSDLLFTRLDTRNCKKSIYEALEGCTGKHLPWGSLTGIRPTKLAYDMLRSGNQIKNIAELLEKDFKVSNKKAQLIQEIICNQKGYTTENNLINLYIHIPFCTSKCNYCSFVSSTIDKQKKLVEPYIDTLIYEIKETVKLIKSLNKTVYSVYIGGGTPTAIDVDLFEKVLSCIPYRNIEYTCEAGRPDTITSEKLDIMHAFGITRISINPQTFNNKTLQSIGRKHTVEEFINKYNLAKKYNFDVNMDLIAGLSGENFEDFKYSVDCAIDLQPENITVHTLSRKNGADLKAQAYTYNFEIDKMIDYSIEKLMVNKYYPYYLYRQKQMLGNLENIGYCLKNKQCINNITTMEECLSVIACGAGGISKRIFNDNGRIERLANLKDIKLYIENAEERLIKKQNFYLN